MTESIKLSARSAALLVVGNMVGSGVFTISGQALGQLSARGVLLAWLIGGALAMLGALSYGALGARYPHSGGEYELLRRTVHPTAGVMAGHVSLLAGFAAPTAYAAHALGAYLAPLVGLDGAHAVASIGSVAVVAISALHLRGVRPGMAAQDLAVLAMTALIVVLIVAGGIACLTGGTVDSNAAESIATAGDSGVDGSFGDGSLAAFAGTCVWVSFAYSGWNAAAYVAGEVRDARRAVPRALLVSTGVVTVLYVALNAVFLSAAPRTELVGQVDIGRVAVAALFGDFAGRSVAVLVALALLTSISAMTVAGPRVYARMAEDGALPRMLAAAPGSPHRPGVLLQQGLALVMLWTASFDALMSYIGYTLSLSTALTVVGLMRVRLRDGAASVPVPGWPVVPLLYVVAVTGIAVSSFVRAPGPAGLALATLTLGVFVDGLRRRRQRAA